MPSQWRAYLDAVGGLGFPIERQATLPVPSLRDGRAVLVGLVCSADYTNNYFGDLVGAESEVVYDLNTGVAEASPIDRRLDEPARGLPPGEYRSIVEAYRELLDIELPIFEATHSLPSPQRFGELTAAIGPGVWEIYRELAPDFTSVVGPFRTT